MIRRSWLGVLAIPVALATLTLIGANKSSPVAAGGVIDPTCTSSLPCIEYDNNGTGPGVRGISLAGNGLTGFTKFNSTATTNARTGVFGDDESTTSHFNSGVRGISVRGTGVVGASSSGAGVNGSSPNGDGVDASGFSTGVNGFASGETGDGVFGVAQPSVTPVSITGVFGVDGTGLGAGGCCGTGVAGQSQQANGVWGMTDSGRAVRADAGSGTAIEASASTGFGLRVSNNGTGADDADFLTGSSGGAALIGLANGEGLEAEGFASSSSKVPAFNATCVHGAPAITATQKAVTPASDIMSLDCSGNMILRGSLTQHGTPLVAHTNAFGGEVGAFSPQQTTQTMEDVGESQLIAGRAYVRLAPDFAATIDRQVNYLVFITPQGDSHGLYVTQKTPAGFEVRENGNGASSIAFDYRIVAKPYGELSKRLPMLRPEVGPDPSMLAVIRRVSEAKSQVGAEIVREREKVIRQTAVSRLHIQALNRRLQSITPAITTHS
jgi:hypothetical protein